LLNELKIVQIYEELNNIVREFDQKKEELKRYLMTMGFRKMRMKGRKFTKK